MIKRILWRVENVRTKTPHNEDRRRRTAAAFVQTTDLWRSVHRPLQHRLGRHQNGNGCMQPCGMASDQGNEQCTRITSRQSVGDWWLGGHLSYAHGGAARCGGDGRNSAILLRSYQNMHSSRLDNIGVHMWTTKCSCQFQKYNINNFVLKINI